MRSSFLKRYARILFYIHFIILPFIISCGFFNEPNDDAPFIFPGVEDSSGNPDGGGGTDLCDGVTCPTGQTCDSTDGQCKPDTTPECTADEDCPDDSNGKNQICENQACQVGCRVNGDCDSGEICNTTNKKCEVEICPNMPECDPDETPDYVNCECDPIPTNTCKVVWQAGIKEPHNIGLKIYIDGNLPAQDLPNECDYSEEEEEFGCVVGGGAENDPALIKECNTMSGQTKTTCLGRRNVPLIPFATRDEKPINLYFVPTNPADPNQGGEVFIRTSEFPEYFIYNTSPDLQANLIIDAGKGELVGPNRQIPEIVGEGTYTVDQQGRISIEDLPLHFRAFNLTKFDFVRQKIIPHDEPPPSNFDTIVTDYADPNFNVDQTGYYMSGLECPSSGGIKGVSIVPPLESAPLVFTTEVSTDAVPDSSFNADVASVITVEGCPLGPASACECTMDPSGDVNNPVCGTNPNSDPDQPWLNMVLGVTIPMDTCLAGLGGAALAAWIGGPVENADGSDFVDLATACQTQGNGGSGNVVISAKVGDDPVILTEVSENQFEAELTIEDEPYYKEETDTNITDIAVLSRFETTLSVTIKNDGTSSDAEPVFDIVSSSSAFEVMGADILNGTSLNTGQERVLHVRFVPVSPQPASCVDNSVDSTKWDCSTDIDVFEGGALTLSVTATARQPAPEIQIVEVGAVQGETYDQTILPILIPGDGQVDYGITSVGTPVIKAFEVSNTGVRDLTVNSVKSQDSTYNFLGGAIRQGPSLSKAGFEFGLLPALVPPNRSDNVYFYETYWPGGMLPASPADCNGKPCRIDSASVLVQTDVGARMLALTGRMTEDVAAKLEVYIEDPVLLDDSDPDNPHLIDCNGILPSYVICTEGNTKAARRVDPIEGYTAFRSDDSTRSVYLVNGNKSVMADDLQILSASDIVFDGGADQDRWVATIPLAEGLFDNGCIQLGSGEELKIGEIAYVPDGTKNTRTLHSASLQVFGNGVNQGSACNDPANESLSLDTTLQGVSGAPDDQMTLTILRMFAGINTALVDGTKVVSTVTPGQAYRASLSGSDRFKIPVIFDAARGIVKLLPVFTPLPPNFTGGPGEIRLYNPTGSGPGSGGQWLFRDLCEADNSPANNGCSDFYLYISQDKESFKNKTPTPPIYTNYKGTDYPNIYALNPETNDFSSELETALGVYDPASGKIQFENNLAIRLFMHPGTALTDNNRVDSAMVLTLTTECLADSEGVVLIPEAGISADIPSFLLSTEVFGAQDKQPDGTNKNTIFGLNPLKKHMDAVPICDAGTNVLRGRRMGIQDTSDNLDLGPSGTPPTGLTFDLAGIGQLKHNSAQLGPPRTMYVVIKACVNQGGSNSCNIN